MKKIDGNRKITLTLGQLKRLVRESASDASDFNIDNGWLRAYYGEGGDVVIPNNVMVICFSVFAKCGKLTSVIIPGSVKSIDEGAFKFCTNLTNVKIGNGVKNIGDDVFWDCKNLKSVTIPDSVTRIGSCAFAGCENLTSITIGTGVTKIGFGVFLKCKNLKTIYVSNEEQKDMIINKDNDLPKSTRIVVKGESSEEELNESRKVTLTLGQLKRLVRESASEYVGAQNFTYAELQTAWNKLKAKVEADAVDDKNFKNYAIITQCYDKCYQSTFSLKALTRTFEQIPETISYGDIEVCWNDHRGFGIDKDIGCGIEIEDGKIKEVY